MEWIEQIQRDLGAPVVRFAIDNWIILSIVAFLGVLWAIRGGTFGVTATSGLVVGESDSSDSGGGGDGGGV
jgi:hypothetical protein